MFTKQESNTYIQEELLSLAYKNLFSSSFAIIVNSIILVYLLWDHVSNRDLSIWRTLISCVTVFRFITSYSYKVAKDKYSAQRWNQIFLLGIILSSILWGSIPFVLFPNTIEYQVILIIIISGMGAGATSSLASHIKAIRIFLFFILIPLIVRLFWEEDSIYSTLAILSIIFLLLLLTISKQSYTTIYDNIETKLLFRQAKDNLKVTQGSFQTIFNQAPVGIFYYNENLIINQINYEFAKILQVSEEMLLGLDLTTLTDTRVLPDIRIVLDGKSGYYEGEYIATLSQISIWITMKTSPIHNANGKIVGGVGIITDITSKVESQKKIEYQAYHDSLTTLPNRSMLINQLNEVVIHYKKNRIISAVLFLDLDHFKKTNDSLGHNIGDELLKSSAKRLQGMMSEDYSVARLGGDEFVVLLTNLGEDLPQAITLVEDFSNEIHTKMKEPFHVCGHTLNVSTSIGISILQNSEDTPEDLLKFADTAMYQSKKDGRGRSCFYQEEMEMEIKHRLDLEDILRKAIDTKGFELYYQPIIKFGTNELIGAEALIRLQSEALGDISPDEFIPIAEETGLIVPIGDWVIQKAISDFLRWNRLYSDYALQTIAINVSTKQFENDNFIESIRNNIDNSTIDPKCIELELTESIIIKNTQESISKMNELRQMGIGISLDDFGTGYSSLSYLKLLPFSSLKIDRSFTQDIVNEKEEQKLINSIISIAKSFNMHIIAEGVESATQYNYLEKRGCDYFQGYYYSKPITASVFEEFMKKKYSMHNNSDKKVQV